MNPEGDRSRLIRQIGAALACMAATFGIALSSGAQADGAFWFGTVAASLALCVFWGVPSLIDVLAYWRQFTTGREHVDDSPTGAPNAPEPPMPVTREIAVHGRGGEGAIAMIDFQDPHEAAWREALARLLWAAQSEGALTAAALDKYLDHREHWVALTDVLARAGLVVKASGVVTRLTPGITFHEAIKRVTRLTTPLPLPKQMPPTVRNAPIRDRSEPFPTGRERSELYA